MQASKEDLMVQLEQIRGVSLAANTDFSRQVVLDLLFGSWSLRVEGDETVGVRADVSAERLGRQERVRLFISPGEGGPKIIGVDPVVGAVGLEILNELKAGRFENAVDWMTLAKGEELGAGSSDPLDPANAALLLPKTGEETPSNLRLAAAVLMLDELYAGEAVELLEESLEEAESDAGRTTLELVLSAALALTDRPGEAAARMLPLSERYPESLQGFLMTAAYLAAAKDWPALEAFAKARVEVPELEEWAWRALGDMAVFAGKRDEAREPYLRLERLGKTIYTDFNQLAWVGLFEEPVSDETLEHALRAAELAPNAEHAVLHTIATVFASKGRPQEAYRVILQAIAAKPKPEPEGVDWYCFGRIAEEYGLREAAIRFYQRIEREEEEYDFSTFALASRRLAGLLKDRQATNHGPAN